MARLYISRVIFVNNCTLLASNITPKASSEIHEGGDSDTSRHLVSVFAYMKGTSFNLLSSVACNIIYICNIDFNLIKSNARMD